MSEIWFFHHYATVPYRNGYMRPYRFAVHLKKKGIHTAVFCSSYHHWSGENVIKGKELFNKETVDGVDFMYVRTPSSAAGGVARVKNMLCFAFRVKKAAEYKLKERKPEAIIASSPHPFSMIAGIRFGKKHRIPCICEIRDLWPEAIFCGSRAKEKSLIGRLLIAGEHWIYRNADALVFTKEGDTDYLKERGWTKGQGGDIDLAKCFYINNGVEYGQYQENITANRVVDADLEDNTFKVLYAGAIRPVNNVGNILEAAKILMPEKDIKFLIYGDGSQKEGLQKQVRAERLDNVIFKGYVENKFIPYVLSKSSVNLLNYSGQNYNWSRGSSSNKLFEYLASGKPVISTVKTGYSIIQKYKCGIELENQTPQGLADAILQIKSMPEAEYKMLCGNASFGAQDFDYSKLTRRLLKTIRYVEGKYA